MTAKTMVVAEGPEEEEEDVELVVDPDWPAAVAEGDESPDEVEDNAESHGPAWLKYTTFPVF